MTSHVYEVTGRQLLKVLGLPALGAAIVASGLHVAGLIGAWPAPYEVSSIEKIVIDHQTEMSRQRTMADVLFLGDSSCLMGIDAGALEQALPNHAFLNLGVPSTVGLDYLIQLARNYGEANPDRLRGIVLLVHPMMVASVRQAGSGSPARAKAAVALNTTPELRRLLQEREEAERRLRWNLLMGIDSGLLLTECRSRLFNRLVEPPLPGSYGDFYGFASVLQSYLTAHDGCALDPYDPTRDSADLSVADSSNRFGWYEWDSSTESAWRTLGEAIPPQVWLGIGITPIPSRGMDDAIAEAHASLLAALAEALNADHLIHLPPTLPDGLFATTTHLNARGVSLQTRMLAEDLARWLAATARR